MLGRLNFEFTATMQLIEVVRPCVRFAEFWCYSDRDRGRKALQVLEHTSIRWNAQVAKWLHEQQQQPASSTGAPPQAPAASSGDPPQTPAASSGGLPGLPKAYLGRAPNRFSRNKVAAAV